MQIFSSWLNRIDSILINKEHQDYLCNIKSSLKKSNFKSYVKNNKVYVLVNSELFCLEFEYNQENLSVINDQKCIDNAKFKKVYKDKMWSFFYECCKSLIEHPKSNLFTLAVENKKNPSSQKQPYYDKFVNEFETYHDKDLTRIFLTNRYPVHGYLIKSGYNTINISFFIEDTIPKMEIGYLNNQSYISNVIVDDKTAPLKEQILKAILPYGITKEGCEALGIEKIEDYKPNEHFDVFKMLYY